MSDDRKLGFFALVALVVGSMIGGGVFSLPSDIAQGAHPGAILLGWLITGVGMISLALVYQSLASRKPDLDGGVYSYARAGFGEYIGFNSAWGYWISAWLGTVAFITLLFGAIGYFFPVFGEGNNLASILGGSLILWGVHFLALRGVREAALVNLVTTIAKLVPLIVFLVLVTLGFKADLFSSDFWGTGGAFEWSSVMAQVKSTMMVTLWVFIGIEGAVVVSGRAKNRKDVGTATLVGLVGTLIIYVLVSITSLGVMARGDLVGLPNPTTAYILESVVGPWGATLINLGLIVSLLGAILGWTLLAAETPYVAAKDGVLPRLFAKENANGAPVASLWITNGLIQIFLVLILFSSGTYQAVYTIASAAILIPYMFSALYQFKLVVTGETYGPEESRVGDLAIGAIASVYSFWLIYAAGLDYLLMCAVLYAPGAFFFWKAKYESGKSAFSPSNFLISGGLSVAAVLALTLMYKGVISPL
ncbi:MULTISPECIES: arginine-ornithine antiporter [Dethiosulfovibrio]|uniref:Arginine-ornithine antiporter n=2 Tax=Dethiosulfovibrio TaxID=47054 RepID=A0ABS9EPV6_9BACT|nr:MULTISPECIES: arginine-ornithine antiporter [Dethiosulfovibrio]MCF4114830.1 arginine-ornithine antiporter [Dethiosulfovibrio russensis]MCF4143227.1 arginine-ornithine antiporter [Dethiosulfovibrio marinus]MCF4145335.1 arginine-ornithine antiporter [Dethiosulfovibrio acidaminovorans]